MAIVQTSPRRFKSTERSVQIVRRVLLDAAKEARTEAVRETLKRSARDLSERPVSGGA